jgi:hypothetical protein
MALDETQVVISLMRVLMIAVLLAVLVTVALAVATSGAEQAKMPRLIQRLQPEYLSRLHQAVVDFRADRKELPSPPGLTDYRVVLHAHSNLSHDSPGTREEIVKAAHLAGVNAIFMSEHPAPTYDFFADGLRGVTEGVLFYPGAEGRGFLTYPTRTTDIRAPADDQALIDEIVGQGGLIFFCHPEERRNWDLHGMTGMEIYNPHADLLDEEGGWETIFIPGGEFSAAWLLKLAGVLRDYSNEVFCSIWDPNTKILAHWDELCQTQRVTGITANDSHASGGVVITYEADDQVVIREILGEERARLDAKQLNLVKLLGRQPKVGEQLLRVHFDPYERSFGYVSTHVFAPELSEEALFSALQNGRCYVAFDWIADPTGFEFEARQGDRKIAMGEEAKWQQGTSLHVNVPIAAQIRLLRNGQPFSQVEGDSLACSLPEPGVYRVEVWTNLTGQDFAWIYSNPIYLRP